MPKWKDDLRPASYKGIPFFVEDHEMEFGRRLSVNEYPFRDKPFTQDMGRRARRYTITAYILGNDYMPDRDALIDAIEAGQSGTLIHPYLGTLEVDGDVGRIRESKNEGGYCIISLNFVESGEKKSPIASPLPDALVELNALALISAARDNFIQGMTIASVPEWVRDNYSDTLSSVSDAFSVIQTAGGINNQATTALINQAAEWVADITELASPTVTLIQDLAGTADRIIDTMRGLFDLSPSLTVAESNLSSFSSFGNPQITAETPSALISNQNALVSENFIKTVAIATEATAIVNRAFPSYEEAIESRSDILERIDVLAGETDDDITYESFRALRSDIASAVPGVTNDLPRIDSVVLKQSLPSLVLAYDLYGNVDRETEIIDRNKVRHPGFLPGGEALSVLRYVEN